MTRTRDLSAPSHHSDGGNLLNHIINYDDLSKVNICFDFIYTLIHRLNVYNKRSQLFFVAHFDFTTNSLGQRLQLRLRYVKNRLFWSELGIGGGSMVIIIIITSCSVFTLFSLDLTWMASDVPIICWWSCQLSIIDDLFSDLKGNSDVSEILKNKEKLH